MKEKMVRAIGKWFLVVGIVMLIAGILLAMSVGTIVTFIVLVGSIFLNTAAITCMRYRDPDEGRDLE